MLLSIESGTSDRLTLDKESKMTSKNTYFVFVGLVEMAMEAKVKAEYAITQSDKQTSGLNRDMIESQLNHIAKMLPAAYVESVYRNYRYTPYNKQAWFNLDSFVQQVKEASDSIAADLLYQYRITTENITRNDYEGV